MARLIGAVVGFLLGHGLGEGTFVTLALAAAGFAAGVLVDRQRRASPAPDVAARLAAIERRLGALESAVAASRGVPAPAASGDERPPAAADAPAPAAPEREEGAMPLPATVAPRGESAVPPRPAYGARPPEAAAPTREEAPAASGAGGTPRLAARSVWAWFTDGNTMTRVGVVILFFGVAFLLSWFAEHLMLSVEASLALVALVGAALVAAGVKLAGSRPGYALSLEGAGTGVLYLTTFAAARLFDVLPAPLALAALAAVAALTVGLAWRADSQSLAGLAFAGAFLAPFLVAREPGEPVLLFAWFAVINAAILALAWHRAWRALNALGAVFTFGLGIFWGWRWYVPAHFAVVQPFLALHFAFYLGVAILYAKRAPLESRQPVDALIVFGVPVAAFALEAGLLTDRRYGAAWAAVAVAAIYAVLFAALRRRQEPGLALLARAFLALAVVFATLAIPFAVDPRWTSAWWALEAAAVYWIGCRQDQPLARAFALVLQGCAAAAFVAGGLPRGAMPAFANATFFGAAMIGAAALASAWSADRHRGILGPRERALVSVVFAWGVAWWTVAGVTDVVRARPAWLGPGPGNAALAWVAASAAAALALRHALAWPRLAWFGAALAPALVLAGLAQFHDARTTLAWPGPIVWPVAWALHWMTLRAIEGATGESGDAEAAPAWLRDAHAASAVALVAWVSWEASEWTGRVTPRGSALVSVVFAWGVAWWTVAGVTDVVRARPAWLGPGPGNAALAWVAASAAAALALRHALAWPRLAWFGAALAPALVLAGLAQFHDARTTLAWPGPIVWPVAWALHWMTLRAIEGATGESGDAEAAPAWLRDAHAASAVALVAWVSWEASEWTGRVTPRGSAWIACAAALPATIGLAATLWRPAMACWPFSRHADAYAKHAGWVLASALAVWFAGTNVVSPGSATPLPWVPVANPLDVTLAAALAALAGWAAAHSGMAQPAREHWLGGALFVAGNGFILRVTHHWGGVPWRLSTLMADRTVQAALTLAWTATALVLMVWASRRASRARWLTGAALLAVVVVKLFAVDLAALSGLPRVAAFLGVGAMLLAIGYFAPPPSRAGGEPPGGPTS